MEVLCFGIRNNDNMTEIDEAIEKGRSILLPSHPQKSLPELFGQILSEAFNCTKKIEYLNDSDKDLEAISICCQLIQVKTPLPQSTQFGIICSLSQSLLVCFQFLTRLLHSSMKGSNYSPIMVMSAVHM
jgi:hypothetical protein